MGNSHREVEVLGLTAQGLSHELNSCFKKYLKYSHVFLPMKISKTRWEMWKLPLKSWKDVLQVEKMADIFSQQGMPERFHRRG